jgi:hypothetical protein
MEVTPTARVNQQCLQKQLTVGRRHRTPLTEMLIMMNGLLGHVAPVYLGTFLDSDVELIVRLTLGRSCPVVRDR